MEVAPHLFGILLHHKSSGEYHWLTSGYSVLDLITSHCGSRPLKEWRYIHVLLRPLISVYILHHNLPRKTYCHLLNLHSNCMCSDKQFEFVDVIMAKSTIANFSRASISGLCSVISGLCRVATIFSAS